MKDSLGVNVRGSRHSVKCSLQRGETFKPSL